MVDSPPTYSEQARSMQSQVPESDPPPYTTTTATTAPLRSTQPGNSSSTTTTTSPAIATTTTTTTTNNQPLSWFKSLVNIFTRSPESAASRRQKKSRRRYSQRIRARERELRTKREGLPGFFAGPAAGGVGAC
ncbi:hypothetical protein P168DRAFT_319124 [Aspergillus campestris IBT 28561]|uniref:Uncharacterized protein n=1 Tax=Aspergillus campestris (strain IBT 28561) TaxID=1392248 RepID=A0A2I1D1B4_ASPC2|nr:uncharacterized protein P168DRAFT_319124 [Aspergillus campestris IBT 28561]PKY03662.1 hypothetical protein P168DRAFT_319124 [Aspergillus campestris IBT 28561]